MKKLLAITLTVSMLLCGCAMADAAVLTPTHAVSADSYGTVDCTTGANFETATAIDDNGNFTYTARLDDLYDADQVMTLKAGDKFMAFGEEKTVETVEISDDEVRVNDGEVVFRKAVGIDGKMVCYDDSETVSTENVESCTFPLANPVHLSTYRLDGSGNFVPTEDGNGIQMDEQDLSPADAKAFFTAHGDINDNATYLSGDGSTNTVTLKDGQVTEIVINWSSDN